MYNQTDLEQFLSKLHVVLVAPQDSLNVGSVVRAMANLEFKNLYLVAPRGYDPKRARITACNAAHLIDNIKIYDSLEDVLAPMQEVIGFSAQGGRNRCNLVSLPKMCQDLLSQFSLGSFKETALVFGPEDTGLTLADLEHCRTIVTIETSDLYTSFNLAQAVLVVMYSLRSKFLEQTEQHTRLGNLSDSNLSQAANWGDFYQLDKILDSVLNLSSFYRPGTPKPIPSIVKQLFRRTEPTAREMGILLGLFRRIEGVLIGRAPVVKNVSQLDE